MNIAFAIIIALLVVILGLTYMCRKLAYRANDAGHMDYARSLEKQLKIARQELFERDLVFDQLGRLFDHVGVGLENSAHSRAAEDLKVLGTIFRSLHHGPDGPFGLTTSQPTLVELGDRYGVEPVSGGPYSIRQLVRIAEEAIESTLRPTSIV